MERQVEVLAGTHLVAGAAGAVVVVAHRYDEPATADSHAWSALMALVGLVREAAAKDARRSGRIFARLATSWLMTLDWEEEVEFGVLTPADSGLAVFLHGGVTAVLAWPERAEVLRGRDAGFTVDRVVIPAPGVGAGLFVDEADWSAERLPVRGIHAMEAGTAPGSGAVMWTGERPAGVTPAKPMMVKRVETVAPAPAPVAPSVAPVVPQPAVPTPPKAVAPKPVAPEPEPVLMPTVAEPVPVFDQTEPVPEHDHAHDDHMHHEPTRVEPVAASASTVLAQTPADVQIGTVVKGFKCARHHLNDPRVSFCAVCGIRMDQLTCVLTDGVRPPLGLLLLDDGNQFVLDTDCVLGREPEHAEAVVKRGARPVRLEDRSGGMSRAHAEIRLIDWDVTVVDGGSTNGTHVRQPGHQEWTRAIPGHPVKLSPGAQVLLGGRVVTFDSQHGQI
ncbi:FHA domain-containing protein [Nocardia sp. NPDC052566]|uniref:FHA domain-containing protein n=1 Tax=Nocardia sp. NPDC052566 TaxID=3364330 RepID=UPI0037C9435A